MCTTTVSVHTPNTNIVSFPLPYCNLATQLKTQSRRMSDMMNAIRLHMCTFKGLAAASLKTDSHVR